MNFPQELKYTKSHEWVKYLDDTTATIGLTEFAQSKLGDLVFINLPLVGDEVTAGQSFSDVESVKAVSDVYSPVSGTVAKINESLMDNPQSINEDPYGSWVAQIEAITESEELLSVDEYRQFVETEED